ncbi:aldose 1-epimerase family protein [Alkalibaculum bacchi]|uniref:aldose 1-epimerase family protein n=1 Tax=Alkalibaculum bacchi TaxID=645887 RepID=UPI0026EB7C86|nr:aldose 1-epimerase family protein [Alkalibaculum bacchi]
MKDVDRVYSISSDSLNVSASILGGALTSVKDAKGIEYLWQGNKTYWSGTAPILFPICGSIRNNRATIGSSKHTIMPRHGIVRKRKWKLESISNSTMTFLFASDDVSRDAFPYDFILHATYLVEGKTVEFVLEVENSNDIKMPFFVGGHPGFNCPLMSGEVYNDYYLEFEREEDCTSPISISETGLVDMAHRVKILSNTRYLELSHKLFYKDMVILDELKSRKVSLRSHKSDVGIALNFKEFPYLILWSSPNGGPFIALEPWLGLSTCSDEDDIFEHKRNVQILAPHAKKKYRFSIHVLG